MYKRQVFIGTGDLALSLGTFPASDARHDVACAAVHAACRKAWTPCGIFTSSLEAAIARRAQGYRMVVTANDIELVSRGLNLAASTFAAAPRTVVEVSRAPSAPIPLKEAAE